MKNKLIIFSFILVSVFALAWTDLKQLILIPNADTPTLFRAYDKDYNPIIDIDSENDKVFIHSTDKLQFRDTGIYLNSSTDGQLDIDADTEVEIAATTIDINGNADISGTLGITGAVTLSSTVTADSMTRGTNAFTTTATADTVVISGLTASSIVVVGGKYVGGVDQQDVLQAECKTDTLIVHRLASGESAAGYYYIRIE